MRFLRSFIHQIRAMPHEMAWILLAAIVVNTASSAYYPFLPLYLETLGATVQEVGLFFTVRTVMAVVFRMVGGWISDTLGRVQTIAISGVVGWLAMMGFALAPSWEWAILGALFGAMGGSLHAPSFQAYVAENAPEGESARTFGLVGSLFQICQIIGPILGGLLVVRTVVVDPVFVHESVGEVGAGWVETVSYRELIWTAAGIFGVGALIRLWIARGARFRFRLLRPARLGRELRGVGVMLLGGGLVTWLFLIDGMHDAGFQVIFPFIPKYITEVGGQSEAMYGVLRAGMAVVVSVATWPAGMLADRFGERWGIAAGGALQAGALGLMLVFSNTVGFAVGFGLFGAGIAFIRPSINSLMSRAVPRESLGMMFGLLWSALGVAAVPAPYVGGWLYDNMGPAVPFGVAVGMLLLTLPAALWKLRVPVQEKEAAL